MLRTTQLQDPTQDKRLSLSWIPSPSKRRKDFVKRSRKESTGDDYGKERRFSNLKNSSCPSGTALLLLPYPDALSLQTTISPFYCTAAVLARNPLAAPDLQIPLKKENTFSEENTVRENLGAGIRGRRTRPAPGRGAGMRDNTTSD